MYIISNKAVNKFGGTIKEYYHDTHKILKLEIAKFTYRQNNLYSIFATYLNCSAEVGYKMVQLSDMFQHF